MASWVCRNGPTLSSTWFAVKTVAETCSFQPCTGSSGVLVRLYLQIEFSREAGRYCAQSCRHLSPSELGRLLEAYLGGLEFESIACLKFQRGVAGQSNRWHPKSRCRDESMRVQTIT